MAIDIGRIAFQKYAEALDGKLPEGVFIPPWEELGKAKQDAWRSAAVAVLQHIDEEREEEARGQAFERDILD